MQFLRQLASLHVTLQRCNANSFVAIQLIVSDRILLFNDKDMSMDEMAVIRAKIPEATLAEFSYNKKERKFEIDTVQWKDIQDRTSAKLVEALKEIADLKKKLGAD